MPVLLAEVFGASEWVKELQGFDIRYVEQLGPLLSTFQGRMALSHLEYPVPYDKVRDEVGAMLMRNDGITLAHLYDVSQRRDMSLLPRPSYGLGYKLPPALRDVKFGDVLPPIERLAPPRSGSGSPFTALSGAGLSTAVPSASPVPFPPAHDLCRILTPVRNQYYRGTCVAFAVTALLESLLRSKRKQSLDLSEQYVYLVTRQNDPDRRESGSYLRYALDGLQKQGACRERLLPYVRWDDWGQAFLFQNPTRTQFTLDKDAYNYRINSYASVNGRSVNAVKQALVNNQPVAVGVPVYENAWRYGIRAGEVSMPLTRLNPDGSVTLLDTPMGGHAIAIVGYVDTPDPTDIGTYRVGGGYFVFKNSWGHDWAAHNTSHGPGFGSLPYEYVRMYTEEAYTIA